MLVFDFLKGTADYEMQIKNPESFINSVKRDVSIKNLAVDKDGRVRMSCFYNEAETVDKSIEKNGGKIIRKKVKGLPVFASRIKHRAGLVAGGLLSVVLVAMSSMFVWEIRVEGNENLSSTQVIEMLDRAGFHEGMLKKSIDVKKVADRLLINEDAVSWLAINFDGTVAHVEMKEAKIAKPYPKKENVNLVASANGIILRVDALDGGTKVSKGEAVTKGQLLVSAFVDKRTGGSLLRGARGFVWAKTERSFGVEVPLEYNTKKYTGKQSKEFCITFLGKTVYFSNPFGRGQERTEYEKNQGKLTLFDKLVFPVTVSRINRSGYSEYTTRRTKEQALEIARKTATERLYEITPGFALADVEEEYTVEDGKLIYRCCFEGVENIAKELEFELS